MYSHKNRNYEFKEKTIIIPCVISKSEMFQICHTQVSMCLTRENITYFIRFLKPHLNNIPFQNLSKTLA